jgi:hypothetical protein
LTAEPMPDVGRVRRDLAGLYDRRRAQWLSELAPGAAPGAWPLAVPLRPPGPGFFSGCSGDELKARLERAGDWADAWRRAAPPGEAAPAGGAPANGELVEAEANWRVYGPQRFPSHLSLAGPERVAAWAGRAGDWDLARKRFLALAGPWPVLSGRLPRLAGELVKLPEPDFGRLVAALKWFEANPLSGLYIRQLPIPGLDTKWLKDHSGLVSNLAGALTGRADGEGGLHASLGLRRPPAAANLRLLDPDLRKAAGGLGHLAAPVGELAGLKVEPKVVFVVENWETGLAFGDLPGAALFYGHGRNLVFLGAIPWLDRARILYWGDIDTYGLAILGQARASRPGIESLLMNEATLLDYRELWSREAKQYSGKVSNLTGAESKLLSDLRGGAWGPNVRLEQERIDWGAAWSVIRSFAAE